MGKQKEKHFDSHLKWLIKALVSRPPMATTQRGGARSIDRLYS